MRYKAVDPSPLPWRPKGETRSEQFEYFCRRFLKVGKGNQKLAPLILRSWQVDICRRVLDSDTRLACLLIGRGNGKSSLLGAIAVFELFTYGESASIVICAVDQRQAGIIFNIAKRFIELAPELASRCQVGKERIFIPSTNSAVDCLPADPKSLEGLDYSTCLLDECGVVSRDTYEVLTLAQGKRQSSRLIAAGTPPANPMDSVLTDLRNLYHSDGDDAVVFCEYSADEFKHSHPADCPHCAAISNPALGDFLSVDALKLSKTARESTFRRQRLCQFVESNEAPYLTPELIDPLVSDRKIPKGANVVISIDGAFGGKHADVCAIVIGTVEPVPHFMVWETWQSDGTDTYQVDLLAVEDSIRRAAKQYNAVEIVIDPYRLQRTGQVLAQEGLTVSEWPWSPARVTRAATDLFAAFVGGKLTWDGSDIMRRHALAATLVEKNGGLAISKVSRKANAPKIDCLASLLQCHSRCQYLGTRPKKRTVSFA